MPRLYKIRFRHYAQRGSDDGFKEFVIADNSLQVVDYIDEEYSNIKGDDETYEWFDRNKNKFDKAEDFGLVVDFEDCVVSGTAYQLAQWLESTYYEEVDDTYYGYTSYDWKDSEEITDLDADFLIQMGICKDIRRK